MTVRSDPGLWPECWVVRAIANVGTEFDLCDLHRSKENSSLVWRCTDGLPYNCCHPSIEWTKGYYRRSAHEYRNRNMDIPSGFRPIRRRSLSVDIGMLEGKYW